MISFDAAIELVRSAATPLDTESLPLARAAGRVLAVPVTARIDSPRCNVSSMDGYAVRAEDLAQIPARLEVVGESFPGSPWRGRVSSGTCTRIFTGAPVPEGANRIIIQEIVEREGEFAIIRQHPDNSPFVRERASDFRTGDELLAKGRLLDARAIVAAGGADVDLVEVFRRPILRIVSTGDELVEPGTARASAAAIPESVSLGVAALARQYGGHCLDRWTLRDDLASMQSKAKASTDDVDIVVVTGGASVGERDFAKEMFSSLKLRLIFSSVAIKPGKPVWLGKVGTKFVLGLPGNPTSAMVTARLLLAPLLLMLQGRDAEEALGWSTIPLGNPLPRCGPRETFHRAVARKGVAEVLSFDHSSAQKVLAEATTLVRQAANSPALELGEMVPVLDF